jgi:pimeloyl-ACP methyl ester carboxylesterase
MTSKARVWVVAIGLVALTAGGAPAVGAPPMPGDDALRAKYALPASKFIDIDGVPIHYVEAGTGPVVVLIHGSYANLRQWDGWAATLSQRYRVIRFDLPPAGLSGPDPGADYSLERKVRLIDDLTRTLKADRFVLVATSSSGEPAAAFAARHPDRIDGLVLNNIAAGPFTSDPATVLPALKAIRAEEASHGDYHTEAYWRLVLLQNMVNADKVTPALVSQWTDLNNRTLRMPPPRPGAPPYFVSTPGDLARITAPTLLLWSAEDHDTALDTEGQKALVELAAPDKALVVVRHCGHMAPMDCSDESLALAMPFIDRITAAKH